MSPEPPDDDTPLARAARRAARASMPMQRFTLGAEPSENLSATTTAEERLAMVLSLSRIAYEIAGIPLDPPPRDQLAGRVIRGASQ